MKEWSRTWGLISIIILLFSSISLCQLVPYQVQLQKEIEKRGITQEELEILLEQKGIKIQDLPLLTPLQLSELQNDIERLQKEKGYRISSDDMPLEMIDSVSTEDKSSNELQLDTVDIQVSDSTTYAIYGHHILKSGQIELITLANNYNPPEHYRIGTGDQLSVSLFGSTAQADEFLTVQPDGSVMIREGRAKVFVRGLTLAQVRDKLFKNYKNYYAFRENQFSVNVSTMRTVSVQVFGEVVRPGMYTVLGANSILNVLAEARGFTNNASVRNIKLIKRNGEDERFDLYQLLTNPKEPANHFIEDGDLIFIPAAKNIVSIKGAVVRPDNYELTESDQLYELIEYAGGLQKDAYLTSFRILRYEDNKRKVLDIPYAELLISKANYPLKSGDQIVIDSISGELENYVVVVGEVRNPGQYERSEGMSITDLVKKAQLKPSSKTDFAFLKRTNVNGTINMIPLSLEDIINGTSPFENLVLQDKDELTIWSKQRFTDNQFIKIAGAVRYEETLPFDNSGSLKASDAIIMAGGLRRDATDYAHIHRFDPLNPNERTYIRLDLYRLMSDPNSADNIQLEPFDSIHVYSKNDFLDDVFVRVAGAVNNPGEFAYGEGMSLKDALVLSGGFKRSSATNDIEVARVIIRDNEPTKTIIQKISLNRSDIRNFGSNDGLFPLEPFDNIFVRYVPEFELQQNVIIEGEVISPGEYSLVEENESVYQLIRRAGGLTEESFALAATLYRNEDSLGYIVMRLDEVLMDPASRYNYVLKKGDIVNIPKKKDYVVIEGATQLERSQNEQIIGKGNSIRVPYHQGKDALFYINYYAGGFADDARKDKIFVLYPNGEVKTTEKKFLFSKKHPEVLPGSIIQVGKKKLDLYDPVKKDDINWTKVLGDSVAQAMSILTLILLVQRLN